jgi:hypothetical protein
MAGLLCVGVVGLVHLSQNLHLLLVASNASVVGERFLLSR